MNSQAVTIPADYSSPSSTNLALFLQDFSQRFFSLEPRSSLRSILADFSSTSLDERLGLVLFDDAYWPSIFYSPQRNGDCLFEYLGSSYDEIPMDRRDFQAPQERPRALEWTRENLNLITKINGDFFFNCCGYPRAIYSFWCECMEISLSWASRRLLASHGKLDKQFLAKDRKERLSAAKSRSDLYEEKKVLEYALGKNSSRPPLTPPNGDEKNSPEPEIPPGTLVFLRNQTARELAVVIWHKNAGEMSEGYLAAAGPLRESALANKPQDKKFPERLILLLAIEPKVQPVYRWEFENALSPVNFTIDSTLQDIRLLMSSAVEQNVLVIAQAWAKEINKSGNFTDSSIPSLLIQFIADDEPGIEIITPSQTLLARLADTAESSERRMNHASRPSKRRKITEKNSSQPADNNSPPVSVSAGNFPNRIPASVNSTPGPRAAAAEEGKISQDSQAVQPVQSEISPNSKIAAEFPSSLLDSSSEPDSDIELLDGPPQRSNNKASMGFLKDKQQISPILLSPDVFSFLPASLLSCDPSNGGALSGSGEKKENRPPPQAPIRNPDNSFNNKNPAPPTAAAVAPSAVPLSVAHFLDLLVCEIFPFVVGKIPFDQLRVDLDEFAVRHIATAREDIALHTLEGILGNSKTKQELKEKILPKIREWARSH